MSALPIRERHAGVCGNSTRCDELIGTTEGRPLRDVARGGRAPIAAESGHTRRTAPVAPRFGRGREEHAEVRRALPCGLPSPARANVHASRMCSVGWEEHTITLTSSDGTEQTVEILYKDALSAAQHWLLTHEYDIERDIQFAPEMAATASEQVFEDYRHSVVNALACAYLPRNQYTFLFDCASDASQCDNSRQTFWAVYIGLGCLREHRRLKADARILVALLPHVDGAEEKSRMYQEAISKVFETMNHAGYHGVRIYLGGARPFRERAPADLRTVLGNSVRAGANGALVPFTVYPLLHAYAADQVEQWCYLALRGGHATNCQCPGCLTPKTALSDLSDTVPEQYGLRTTALRVRLTEAIEDKSGAKAKAMFPTAATVPAALKLAKDRFDACSFRWGVTPAWHDAPACDIYIISGMGYDPVHSGWLGPFRRLCHFTLAEYADGKGYSRAAALLNNRVIASGRHDGQRCPRSALLAAPPLRRVLPPADCRRQVPAERALQGRAERQIAGPGSHVARSGAQGDGPCHAVLVSGPPRTC